MLWFIGLLLSLAASQTPSPVPETREYRPAGPGNNIKNPRWGDAVWPYERYYIPAIYPNGDMEGIDYTKPNPRSISHKIRKTNGIGHSGSPLNVNQAHTFWGMWILLDITTTSFYWPWEDGFYFHWIDIIEQDDIWADQYHWGQGPPPQTKIQLPALVGHNWPGTGFGTDKPFVSFNAYTSMLDLSQIYGNSPAEEEMFHDANTGYLVDIPMGSIPLLTGLPGDKEPGWLMGGDIRINKTPAVFAWRQLFKREHNRLVDEFKANNPSWSASKLYHESKRLNIAFFQNTCVREYLAALVGQPLEPYVGYNDTLNPTIDLFFTDVAFRYAHTALPSYTPFLDDDLKNCPHLGGILLREALFKPTNWLQVNKTDPLGPLVHDHASVFRGISSAPTGEVGPHMTEDLRDFTFAGTGREGLDLMSYNILRGRESGLPDYNTCREIYGLPRVTTFSDITPNVRHARMLEEIYGSVDKIDAYIGAISEAHPEGSEVGPLMRASILDQFRRLRDGDRFWFESLDQFTVEEIEMVHGTKVRDLIFRNFDDISNDTLPVSPFFLEARQLFSSADSFFFPEPRPNYGNWTWSTKQVAPFYRLHWIIDRFRSPQTITIQLQVKTDGWAGIGFKPEQFNTMKGADIVICRTENEEIICDDRKALDVGIPKNDVTDLGTSDDLFDISGFREDGILNVMFSRKLNTGDEWDNTIGDETRIIFAFHPTTNELRYHGPTRQSTIVVDFLKEFRGPPLRRAWSDGVKIFLYVLAGIGICSALMFLVLIAVATEHFQFQTPEFCALICVGAIIGYISIILILPDQQTDDTCKASIWLFGMSFWIVFAGMFVKIGRVWWIVRALTKDFEQLKIPLWQLLIPMTVCILGEVVFQICWDVLIPPDLEREINYEENIYYEYCAGNRFMWLGSTVVRAVFLGIGVYLALQTREFQKEINWSKELVLSIYTLAVVLIILIPLGYAISENAVMVVLLKGLGIFVAYFTVTCIMFFDSTKRIFTGEEPRSFVSNNSVSKTNASSASSAHSVA